MHQILEVETADFNAGGTEQFILKNAQFLNKDTFSVDFLCCGHICDQAGFETFQNTFHSAESLNISYGIFRSWHIFFQLVKYLKSHPCDIMHIHNGFVANLTVCAMAAKFAGVRHIICHLHGTDLGKAGNPLKTFLKTMRKKMDLLILGACATDFFTCSRQAAKLTYGDRFLKKKPILFFPNAIDVNNFLYDPLQRENIRSRYHLTDQLVIGTVGRLSQEKNQLFLLDILKELTKRLNNVTLMLVGDGPSRQDIQDRVRQMHLEDKVILTGSVNNVGAYLQAFDVFILPSFTEAFPIVMVESQAAGLPTIVSDVVTRETAITDLVQFVSLDASVTIWCDTILSSLTQSTPNKRKNKFQNSDFDMQKVGKNLEKQYLSLLDRS